MNESIVYGSGGMKQAIVFGSGGMAKELIGYLMDQGIYSVRYCVSTEPFNNPDYGKKYPVHSDVLIVDEERACFLAIADSKVRENYVNKGIPPKFYWQRYIDPTCTVSKFCDIETGCILAPQSIVVGDAKLGRFVFLNTNATVGHDSVVGDFCTLMPNCEVCGDCNIGDHCFIGIGAYILPGVTLAPHVKVSAGAIVRKSILRPGVTVYGDPATIRTPV